MVPSALSSRHAFICHSVFRNYNFSVTVFMHIFWIVSVCLGYRVQRYKCWCGCDIWSYGLNTGPWLSLSCRPRPQFLCFWKRMKQWLCNSCDYSWPHEGPVPQGFVCMIGLCNSEVWFPTRADLLWFAEMEASLFSLLEFICLLFGLVGGGGSYEVNPQLLGV